MSLTPEQIVQERVNFAGFIAGRTTSTILPYVAIWLACAESKQAEIDAVRLANIDAKQWIGSGKLEIDALKALVAELEKDAARLDWLEQICRDGHSVKLDLQAYESVRGEIDRRKI